VRSLASSLDVEKKAESGYLGERKVNGSTSKFPENSPNSEAERDSAPISLALIAGSLRGARERFPLVIPYQENLTAPTGTVSQSRENFRTYARADTDRSYRRRDRVRAERAIR